MVKSDQVVFFILFFKVLFQA